MMYWHPQVFYNYSSQPDFMNRNKIEQLYRIMEQQLAATNEILTTVQRHDQLLTMLYSRQFGAYPPSYGGKGDNQ
ncbi:hypothetical protein J7E23_08675 [Pseudomonas sp. ISL-88]|uniref:hypothetical protein n=1 Tax=Bacteria TaxID=2 RepID=UPI001BEAAA3C|nr:MULTISPECIES: hypothetical protein [Bacteria]MBT2712910.1 hypothetical protein [Pseudomonas sp. ISL-88]